VIYGWKFVCCWYQWNKVYNTKPDKLKDKKVVVFATGASPFREEAIRAVRDKNFTYEERLLIIHESVNVIQKVSIKKGNSKMENLKSNFCKNFFI
jgi:hypothetical protein